MRKAAVGLLVLLLSSSLRAEETLEEKRDKKLAEPWLAFAGWITDYDAAREEAKKSDKLIFAYFTRSYAY